METERPLLNSLPKFSARVSGWRVTASLVAAAACWGLGTVISKGVLTYVPPLTLLVIQLAASLIFLWAAISLQRLHLPSRKEAMRLGISGFLNPGLAYTFGLLGLSLTTAAMSSLIWAAEPILILALAALILREPLTRLLLGFSFLAVIGAVLVIGMGGDFGSLWGNLLILAGVFCCAIYTVLARRLVTHFDPLLLIALQQTVSLVWALLIWPIEFLQPGLASLAAISPYTWAWAIASGVIYYALAFWFYLSGLKKTSASRAASFLNLIPIFGVGGAYLFLAEALSAAQWVGTLFILTAVVAISRIQIQDEAQSLLP
ncbi:MAG: DMT family transporter [Anaerolineae bacterium]